MSKNEQIQDVNIELGDTVSEMLYEASKLTHGNRPGLLTEFHESFSGARAISLAQFPDTANLLMNLGFDGVGTKVEVAERLRNHTGVAFDLFAMVCDDAVVRGAEPIAIGSILDVRQLNDTDYTKQAVRELAEGYVRAAQAAGVVVVNGEVAELGDRIDGFRQIIPLMRRVVATVLRRDLLDNNFNYNWGAAALWLAHKDRLLTGYQIQPGDKLIGLQEPGFRSNGITDVRKTLRREYGRKWHEQLEPMLGNLSLGELVQTPATIYAKAITEMTGGYDISKSPKATVTGVAHITGGGQPSKLGRMLGPSGLGAVIDTPIDPPEVMRHVQKLAGLSDRDSYKKWHMGPGMVVATPEPGKVVAIAAEHDIAAQPIGEVTDESGIRIKNRGVMARDEWLTF